MSEKLQRYILSLDSLIFMALSALSLHPTWISNWEKYGSWINLPIFRTSCLALGIISIAMLCYSLKHKDGN